MSEKVGAWWTLEGKDLVTRLIAKAGEMRDADDRLRDLVAWRDLYVDAPRDDWAALGLFRDRRARLNAVQNAVDAVHARLSKARTRPWIVTLDGDYETRERARKASLWLDGMFDQLDLYNLLGLALHDALVFGTGVVEFYVHDGKMCAELRWCGDLFVDRREERFRAVRTMYKIVGVDRGVLKSMYPKAAKALEDAPTYQEDTWLKVDGGGQSADLVQVVEAWRLPDGPESTGRHTIVTPGIDDPLHDEEWDRPTFPFEFIHWARDPLRFWGQGLVERSSGLQAELNLMSATLEESFRRCPPASLWIEASSEINAKQITNSPWEIYTYSGTTPPVPMVPTPISADYSAREETILRRIYELQGISQLSAQSQKPAGLNSGRALTVHQNIESERFYPQVKAFENAHVGAAKQLLCAASEQDDYEQLTIYAGDKDLEQIRFVDADLKDKPHQIRVFPVSALSSSPEGKIEDIQNLVNLGVLTDPSDIRELLDFPDLDRYNSLESAARRLCDKMIGEALKGKAVAAHPLLDLNYLLRRGTLEHDLAQERGASLDQLQSLRDLLGQAESLLPPPPMPMAPPAGPGGPAPMPEPGAMPMAPEMNPLAGGMPP